MTRDLKFQNVDAPALPYFSHFRPDLDLVLIQSGSLLFFPETFCEVYEWVLVISPGPANQH